MSESLRRKNESSDRWVEGLLENLRPKIEGVLWRYRIPPQDCEDLLQEVLLTFVRRYERIENHEAWLLVALRNQCSQFWRRRRRKLYDQVDAILLEVMAPCGPSHAQPCEQATDLRRFLPRVPGRCREVLEMRYFLGHTPKEVAIETGYRHSGISTIIRRCLAALTNVLLAAGYVEGESDG